MDEQQGATVVVVNEKAMAHRYWGVMLAAGIVAVIFGIIVLANIWGSVRLVAILAGLLVAGTVHAVKAAAVRPAITATTGGAGNVPVSIAEDVTATALSVLAILVPILLGCLLVLLTSLIIWGIWRRENSRRTAQLRS